MGDGTNPLKASDLLVQLVDIPSSIANLAGLGITLGEGRAIFSNYVERDVDVFLPTRSISTIKKRSSTGGENRTAGVFGHFVYSLKEGWKSLPEIDIVHEGWMDGVF